VDSILLEDLLATVDPKVAIMKIDVEGWECKVVTKQA
jgi:Tfp pilus assembly protein PilN